MKKIDIKEKDMFIVRGDHLNFGERVNENGHYLRAFKLSNHVVISVNDTLMEYEDKMFYEVNLVIDELFNPVYERTGKTFKPEDLNNIVKREDDKNG